ncbi:MBL fold metallo-hydrolase [Deinococcus hohokamensis]|uniref:MBL fold metallo-hydrolase n=1 Tax=Deinococcus hohokamensis TaxID=309883 RepID=A0ABV9I7H1_9DEIO
MAEPIKMSEHVYALPINAVMMGTPTTIFPALILDETHGATLVDTGILGMEGLFQAALQTLSLSWTDVKRIIVTHHDLDHIGSLPAIVAATGAEVLALETEVPYVQGEKPGQKQPSPEMIAGMPPEMLAVFANPPKAHVTQVLHDGEVLDLAGGVKVIATPGHTVGHLSLYVQQDGVLITGDALTSAGGQLNGPSARMTPDMDEAQRSVRKLAQESAKAVLTYHGGLVLEDAAAQLVRVAAEADS